eukprot:6183727-Pleurochrysis_carterae.AAC.3
MPSTEAWMRDEQHARRLMNISDHSANHKAASLPTLQQTYFRRLLLFSPSLQPTTPAISSSGFLLPPASLGTQALAANLSTTQNDRTCARRVHQPSPESTSVFAPSPRPISAHVTQSPLDLDSPLTRPRGRP